MYTGTGLESEIPSVRKENHEKLSNMLAWSRGAKHTVAVGDCGTEYFYGYCQVVALDQRTVTVRDRQGNSHRFVRKHWLGLKEVA